jgi:hypothetical protein
MRPGCAISGVRDLRNAMNPAAASNCGRASRFSLDALVNIATAIGRRVHFELEAA